MRTCYLSYVLLRLGAGGGRSNVVGLFCVNSCGVCVYTCMRVLLSCLWEYEIYLTYEISPSVEHFRREAQVVSLLETLRQRHPRCSNSLI